MFEKPKELIGRPPADRTGEKTVSDEGLERMRPTVAAAVRGLRDRMPKMRANGIFRHPPDWTEEEIAFIADCLKQNVPLYTIANMVHCEKRTLSKLVKKTPELAELQAEKYENLLDEAEYQADRLMKQGNPSMVIYVLQTLGRKRGWAEDDESKGKDGDVGRIVMGTIPEEEVKRAEEETARLRGDDAAGKETRAGAAAEALTNPVTLAAIETAVKAEVDRQTNTIEVPEGEVHPPPYGETGEGIIGGGPVLAAGADDPWAEGADSMFFQ